LTALTTLDLSHNHLKSLPPNFFAFPNLTILNISHNELTTLPFREPFANPKRQNNLAVDSFFSPIIVRASSPLPCLVTLDASHNKISANGIDLDTNSVPVSLSKLDLSFNPLNAGEPKCRSLLQSLSKLSKLRELLLVGADIGDDDFPPDLFSPSLTPSPFPSLKSLNLGETRVTVEAAKEALRSMEQELSFYVTTEDPPAGVVRVIVGKKVIKETWEIEAEQRAKSRPAKFLDADPVWTGQKVEENAKEVAKEPWEIDADQGLLTEGGRRRARAAAAAAPSSQNQDSGTQAASNERVVVKESWEIEAELGLLTEGGRRRARIAAAAAAKNTTDNGKQSSPSEVDDQSLSNTALLNPQYYTSTTQTLRLPSSAPPSKAHSRAFSLAAPSSSWLSTTTSTADITLPTPTLPLGLIVVQPFAQTLKILVLANRRMDRSVSLPPLTDGAPDGPWLPNLEELNLEGCGLGDTVPVSRLVKSGSGASSPPRSSELLLPLLTRLFPGIRKLDLSYNVLTSASIQRDILSSLILSTPGVPSDPTQPPRKGLRQLRLRGNRIAELDGLQGIAELFKRNREVPEWKLDELDIRDNEISKLPPELGLMPLDVFLVDGNL
jgi:Leucine-rich repeat (LRR) protein